MPGCWDCFAAMGRAIASLFTPAPVDARGLYERVTGQNGPVVLPTAAQVAAWPATPGGQFMNAQAFAALTNADVLGVTNTLHAQLGGWTWAPGVAAGAVSAGAELLQGSRVSGECAAVANALSMVLTTAAPYGLAQGPGNFTVRTYSGAHNQGFIAAHAPILNLNPNVYDPATGNRQNFYVWDNHKTVEYNGEFFDACYNTSYMAQANMAQAQLQQSVPGFNAASFPNNFVLDVVMTDGLAPLALRGFYVQCFYNGANIAADAAAVHGGGYDTVFVGPFVIGGAGVAANFGFNPATDYLAGVALH